MFGWLWGLKTVAVFDVWSIEHILTGLSIGSIIKKDNKRHFKKHYPSIKITKSTALRVDFLGILFLAYLWEAVEHYLEIGLAGNSVQHWFQGVEFWPNRLITDPLMMVVGYWIATKYPKIVMPSRILSITWLLIHIFIFPHSMFLHEFF